MSEERRGRRLQIKFETQDKDAYFNGLKGLVETAAGRRFVWIFCLSLGLENSAFSGKRSHTDYNLGRKSAAEDLLREIRDNHPEHYLQMIKELQDVHQQRMAATAGMGDTDRGDLGDTHNPLG